MATKLKNLSRSFASKCIAFIIVILSVTLFFGCAVDMYYNTEYPESLWSDSYLNSMDITNEYDFIIDRIKDTMLYFQNEDYIKSGALVTKEKIINKLHSDYDSYIIENGLQEVPYMDETYKAFEHNNKELVEIAKKDIIDSQISRYNKYKSDIESIKGIYYYATNGTDIYTNVSKYSEEYFRNQPSYVMIDYYDVKTKPQSLPKTYTMEDTEYFADGVNNIINPDIYMISIAMTEEYLKPNQDRWVSDRSMMIRYASIMTVSFIIGLLGFIYLIMVVGRKNSDDDIHLGSLDKLWNDFNIILIFIIMILLIGTAEYIIDYYPRSIILTSAVTALGASICLILFLSLVKHIKNKTFIKHTCTYKIITWLYKLCNNIIYSGPLMVKVIGILIVYSILLLLMWSFFPLPMGIMIYYIYRKVVMFKSIQNGVKYIKAGEFDYKINVQGEGELKRLSDDINSIADGLKNAVNKEVKSERMKTELVTNVSHDIKTPLTSIITYIDLLKREGLNSEHALEYLDVLDRKSQRLKTLTDNLFEAAKASSGSMDVNMEKVDVLSLVQQGLAELDDKVKESNLGFRINAPEEKVYAKADGKLVWRIIENLLSNVFKYALKGSRVYIDIRYYEDKAVIIIKNISAYELNISADELLERFTRGDESRNTEGSGLGLNIAKSLAELQNGSLKLKIDGDLFKAQVMLMRYDEQN